MKPEPLDCLRLLLLRDRTAGRSPRVPAVRRCWRCWFALLRRGAARSAPPESTPPPASPFRRCDECGVELGDRGRGTRIEARRADRGVVCLGVAERASGRSRRRTPGRMTNAMPTAPRNLNAEECHESSEDRWTMWMVETECRTAQLRSFYTIRHICNTRRLPRRVAA